MANQETIEKILNKKFKKAVFSGYDSADVDSFYDKVIEYLKNNDKMVESYKDDALKLKEQVKNLTSLNATLNQEKVKLEQTIKEYQEEGYGSMLLKQRSNKQGE
ncbi:MAG: DivIVA domain-containing protein [Mycoplasmoidaceae bacterium]|nr:DivIVA domain-containing protein [Mycoplasmoidaceae bacterium]